MKQMVQVLQEKMEKLMFQDGQILDMAIYHGAYWTDVEFNKTTD